MAESLIGKVIEFLIGLIILPRIILLIWVLGVPYFGLEATTALIAKYVFSVILLIITFFLRKVVGAGFLIGIIWDAVTDYLVLSEII